MSRLIKRVLDARQASAAAPVDLTSLQTFPKLLASTEDDRINGHHSYELMQALGQHSDRMKAVEQEYGKLAAADQTYGSYSSQDLANAFQEYADKHHGEALPQSFTLPSSAADGADSSSTTTLTTAAAVGGTTAAIAQQSSAGMTIVSYAESQTYAWSTLLHGLGWARILYTIVWIVTGLALLFFGYASLFWLHKVRTPKGAHSQDRLGASLAQALPGLKNSKKRRSASSPSGGRAVLRGGLGGVLIGFLFFSYLTSVITNAVCVDHARGTISSAAFFAVWLAPGLLGAALGGYFSIVSRAMAGILGATCLTIILTAVFGIQTLLVRIILISIFCVLLTGPLLQTRAKVVQMMVLNACTSLIGMVTFLNGVALVAPSVEPSSNWLDLWTLLFMRDSATSSHALVTSAWGTSVFKGYIAGAVLGTVVGFVFELVLHRRCGHDPEAEWNQYLGNYTQHIENGTATGGPASMAAYDDPSGNKEARAGLLSPASPRAGMFEPAPSAWQRMVDFFDSESARPAHYGNLSGDGTLTGSEAAGAITLRSTSLKEKLRKKRAAQANGPARFSALRKHDHDDDEDDEDEFDDASSVDDDDEKHAKLDDDDATEVGSVNEGSKRGARRGKVSDLVPSLTRDSDATVNYGGYALPLPRPPFVSASSSSSSASGSSRSMTMQGGGDSRLTGSTVAAANASASSGSSHGGSGVHKPMDRYSDRSSSPSAGQAAATPASPNAVPATPSLINAISRIQLAQQQARAWQEQQQQHGAPYDSPAQSPPKKS